MDIRLENLAATAFRLQLPANRQVGAREVALADVSGLGGSLHTEPGLVTLDQTVAGSGSIAELSWPIGPTAQVRSVLPIALSQVAIDARFQNGFSGTVGAENATAERLSVSWPTLRLATDLTGEAIEFVGAPSTTDRSLITRAVSFAAADLQLQSDSWQLRATGKASAVNVETGAGPATVHCGRLEISDFKFTSGGTEIVATDIECSKGVAFKNGDTRVDEITAGSLKVTIALAASNEDGNPKDVDGSASQDEAPAEVEAPIEAPRDRVTLGSDVLADDIVMIGPRRLIDLRDLDRLKGLAEISVYVKAHLPVVGKYRLDRSFKIPISSGQIDFVDVERQLGTIEDAFIDFAVRDEGLVLIRDIPLLPTKGKTLVTWPLTSVEMSLAKHNVVSLRALTRAKAAKAKAGDSKANISTIKVDISSFEVALEEPQSPAPSGTPSEETVLPEVVLRAFETLKIDGGFLIKAAKSDPQTPADQKLDAIVRSKGFELALNDFQAGGKRIRVGSLRAGDLEIKVTEWRGLRPAAIAISLKDVVVSAVAIRDAATKQPPATS